MLDLIIALSLYCNNNPYPSRCNDFMNDCAERVYKPFGLEYTAYKQCVYEWKEKK